MASARCSFVTGSEGRRGKEREGRSADSWSTVGQQTADSIFWELFFTFTEFSQCNDMASINYYNCTQFHLWELNI